MITAINEQPDGTAIVVSREIDDEGKVVEGSEKQIATLQKDEERPKNEFAEFTENRRKEIEALKADLDERKISYPTDASKSDLEKLAKASAPVQEEPSDENKEEHEKVTVASLKAILDERKVEYPSKATKADLEKLVAESEDKS